jgi:SAM-dependent methyltransferase
MIKKNMNKLAGSFKKRLREFNIFLESRKLPNFGQMNTNLSVAPIKTPDNIESSIPYDEEYFEKNYGDMKKNRKKDSKVIYNTFEFYLVLDAIVRYLKLDGSYRSQKILEVGCNNGYTVMLFRQMGYEAYGIDISDYAFKQASDFVRPFLFKGSFADIPFADNTFDITISWGTIEHLPEEESSKCLSEAIRVSKKAIWIGCDNVPQLIEPYHLTNHPIDWWEKKLEALGQKVDNNLRNFIRHQPFLWKRKFYWDALECVLKK